MNTHELDTIIAAAEANGWHAQSKRASTPVIGWQTLTHDDVPNVSVDVIRLTSAPHFIGRVMVDKRERAQVAHLGDLRSMLVDTAPADAFKGMGE